MRKNSENYNPNDIEDCPACMEEETFLCIFHEGYLAGWHALDIKIREMLDA